MTKFGHFEIKYTQQYSISLVLNRVLRYGGSMKVCHVYTALFGGLFCITVSVKMQIFNFKLNSSAHFVYSSQKMQFNIKTRKGCTNSNTTVIGIYINHACLWLVFSVVHHLLLTPSVILAL